MHYQVWCSTSLKAEMKPPLLHILSAILRYWKAICESEGHQKPEDFHEWLQESRSSTTSKTAELNALFLKSESL